MDETEKLAEWDRRHLWHAFTPMATYESLVIERAKGVWLYDTQGNRYLDGVSSLWCNLLGHGREEIDAALHEQLDRVAHSTSLGMGSKPAVRLAKRLADLAPGDLSHAFFSSDGASAVEAAMKMAFQYWRQCERPRPEKTKFVALADAYHGDTLGAASLGGIDSFAEMFAPLLLDVIRLPSPNASNPPEGVDREACCAFYLQQAESVLADRNEEIAALVIEPLLQGAAGMILQPPGYLRGLRELTRKYNVLLIADEIVTGFGRTGRMFACDHEAVVPDLLCLGKSITGGYLPLSATLATDEIYSAFLGESAQEKTFFHGHTYGGNPLAAAAALATLDVLEKEQTIARLEPKIQQLSAILGELHQFPDVMQTRQLGLIGAVQLAAATGTEERLAARVCREALQRGLWIRPLGDVLVVMPPLSITEEELDLLGRRLSESLQAATSEALSHAGSKAQPQLSK